MAENHRTGAGSEDVGKHDVTVGVGRGAGGWRLTGVSAFRWEGDRETGRGRGCRRHREATFGGNEAETTATKPGR